MTRRELAVAAGGVACLSALRTRGSAAEALHSREAPFPEGAGLTHGVAEFIARTSAADVPDEVVTLGKKSLLDALGLALCGGRSSVSRHAQAYVATLGLSPGGATVIGSATKLPPRF